MIGRVFYWFHGCAQAKVGRLETTVEERITEIRELRGKVVSMEREARELKAALEAEKEAHSKARVSGLRLFSGQSM